MRPGFLHDSLSFYVFILFIFDYLPPMRIEPSRARYALGGGISRWNKSTRQPRGCAHVSLCQQPRLTLFGTVSGSPPPTRRDAFQYIATQCRVLRFKNQGTHTGKYFVPLHNELVAQANQSRRQWAPGI